MPRRRYECKRNAALFGTARAVTRSKIMGGKNLLLDTGSRGFSSTVR